MNGVKRAAAILVVCVGLAASCNPPDGDNTGGGSGSTGGGTATTGGGTATTGGGSGTGCTFDGVWLASKAAGPNDTLNFHFDAPSSYSFTRVGASPTVNVDGTSTFNASNSELTMTNNSVTTTDTAFDGCVGVAGTYTLTFSDCTHFTLALVSDSCSTRVASVGSGSTVFTRQ